MKSRMIACSLVSSQLSLQRWERWASKQGGLSGAHGFHTCALGSSSDRGGGGLSCKAGAFAGFAYLRKRRGGCGAIHASASASQAAALALLLRRTLLPLAVAPLAAASAPLATALPLPSSLPFCRRCCASALRGRSGSRSSSLACGPAAAAGMGCPRAWYRSRQASATSSNTSSAKSRSSCGGGVRWGGVGQGGRTTQAWIGAGPSRRSSDGTGQQAQPCSDHPPCARLGMRGADADAHARGEQRGGGEAHHHHRHAARQEHAAHGAQLGGVEHHHRLHCGCGVWGGWGGSSTVAPPHSRPRRRRPAPRRCGSAAAALALSAP